MTERCKSPQECCSVIDYETEKHLINSMLLNPLGLATFVETLYEHFGVVIISDDLLLSNANSADTFFAY